MTRITFNEAQPLLLPGDVLLFQGTHPHSKVIEAYTNSKYSHAALVGGNMPNSGSKPHLNRTLVVEALEPHGVRMYPLSRYLDYCYSEGCRVDWFGLRTSYLPIRAEIVRYAVDQLGRPYAMGQVLWSFSKTAIFFRRTLRRLFRVKLPVYVERKHWFCSQLVAEAYARAGYDLPKMPAAMSPQDIAEQPFLRYRCELVPNHVPIAA